VIPSRCRSSTVIWTGPKEPLELEFQVGTESSLDLAPLFGETISLSSAMPSLCGVYNYEVVSVASKEYLDLSIQVDRFVVKAHHSGVFVVELAVSLKDWPQAEPFYCKITLKVSSN